MKTNIALICLLNNYNKSVSKLLSERLDMFCVDVDEMVEYELGDITHVLASLGNKEGKKYIKSTETRVVKNISGFDNTVISINPTTMFSNRNFDRIAKNAYVVYLQISPKFFSDRAEGTKDIISEDLLKIAFTDRDKTYVQKSDMVVNCSKLKDVKAVKAVMKSIRDFFKKSAKEPSKK